MDPLSDEACQQFIEEFYSSDLDSPLCPGNGVPLAQAAIRDAFFNGVRTGWKEVVRRAREDIEALIL